LATGLAYSLSLGSATGLAYSLSLGSATGRAAFTEKSLASLLESGVRLTVTQGYGYNALRGA